MFLLLTDAIVKAEGLQGTARKLRQKLFRDGQSIYALPVKIPAEVCKILLQETVIKGNVVAQNRRLPGKIKEAFQGLRKGKGPPPPSRP